MVKGEVWRQEWITILQGTKDKKTSKKTLIFPYTSIKNISHIKHLIRIDCTHIITHYFLVRQSNTINLDPSPSWKHNKRWISWNPTSTVWKRKPFNTSTPTKTLPTLTSMHLTSSTRVKLTYSSSSWIATLSTCSSLTIAPATSSWKPLASLPIVISTWRC